MIDAPSSISSLPVGRATQDRVDLIYNPGCLTSFLYTAPTNCDTDRSFYSTYPNMEFMQQGLLRAVIYWTDYFEEL